MSFPKWRLNCLWVLCNPYIQFTSSQGSPVSQDLDWHHHIPVFYRCWPDPFVNYVFLIVTMIFCPCGWYNPHDCHLWGTSETNHISKKLTGSFWENQSNFSLFQCGQLTLVVWLIVRQRLMLLCYQLFCCVMFRFFSVSASAFELSAGGCNGGWYFCTFILAM